MSQDEISDTYYATYSIKVPAKVAESGNQKKITEYVETQILQTMDIEGLTYDLQEVEEG